MLLTRSAQKRQKLTLNLLDQLSELSTEAPPTEVDRSYGDGSF
jgi:hypothetical protein